MNSEVDRLVAKVKSWRAEFEALRKVALGCGLAEQVKWGQPCYTLEGRNIVLIHGFKEYCALLFFKGALMKDPDSILIQQTENVQAGRQIRFTDLQEIIEQEAVLKAYIREAITVEQAGLKVPLKKTEEFAIPEEFQDELDENPALKAAFEALTPGRQRAYLLHFSAPKQSKTRTARIEKCVQLILAGRGLND